MNRLHLFVTLIVMLLTGCGGGSGMYESKAPASNAGYYAQQPSGGASYGSASYESTASADQGISPTAPPPMRSKESVPTTSMGGGSSGEMRAPDPRPQDRPGLGTEFGETRTSRVRDVTFVRADAD